MPDPSALDDALVARLLADDALMAEAIDGVYIDEAPPGAKQFVIVSLVDALDVPQFGGRAYEDNLYMVKFVALSTAGANVATAAARLDALLEDGTLTIPGYTLMTMRRESRLRQTEVDDADPSLRWQHRGGRYRVMVST